MSDQVFETRRGPGVFISYRRGETAGQARALHELLEQRLGEGRVFMDVDAIALGEVFATKIGEAIASSGVTLVLIGHDWFNESNKARLFQNEDFIRLEIETALQRRVPIIPILIERATMPKSEELPEGLRPLTGFQALDLENQRWDFDVNRLITAVESLVSRAPQTVPVVGKPHQPVAPSTVVAHHLPHTAPAPVKDAEKKTPSRKLIAIVAAAVVVVVAVVAVVALLPKKKNTNNPPSNPTSALVSAAKPVSNINPDRLVDELIQASFGTTDLPSDVTASPATLSVFRVEGLVAPVLIPMSGPADLISVNYAVFANPGNASQYFATYQAEPSGYAAKGSFPATGVGDQIKCLTSFGSKFSEWASSCAVLSNNVVTFVQVQDSQRIPNTDDPLVLKVTKAGIAHLRQVAMSSPSAAPVAPPGGLSTALLFSQLGSKVGALPDDVTSANATISSFAVTSPPQGLVSNQYVAMTITGGDGYGDSSAYIQYYVFDTAADASTWYGGTGLIPGSDAVKVSSIDSSGFSQTANCATYTSPKTSTSPEFGDAFCSILDGDVVVATRTSVASTTAFGDENLAVMLARQGIINIDLLDGA